MKKNENGFGAIEGLLIVIIVGMIGFVGWFVWHNQAANTASSPTASTKDVTTQKATPTTSPAKTTVDQYADWKTYKATLKTNLGQDVTFDFKYPVDWIASSDQYAIEMRSPDFKSTSEYSYIASGSALTVSVNKNDADINNHTPTLSEIADTYMGVANKKAITINGLQALQFSNNGQGQYSQLVTLLSRGGLIYTFSQKYTSGAANPNPNLLQGVLDTLKF